MLSVKVWGSFACFTRPEFGVERVSYEVMTPSAARGILESIFWKPEFAWRIHEIHMLKPIRHYSILRNEINTVQSDRSAKGWATKGGRYYADDDRAQRHTLCLRDVAYVIKADIALLPHTKAHVAKYRDQFRRRVARGQCFNQPYLGTREFSAFFSPATDDDVAIDVNDHLGLMLFDLTFSRKPKGNVSHLVHDENGAHVVTSDVSPIFFQAELKQGVLHVPQELYEVRT